MRKSSKLSLSKETLRHFEVPAGKAWGGAATQICVTHASKAGASCYPVVCVTTTVASACC
jgi:hypothetical protein